MRELQAYHCDYCKKYSKSKSVIRQHEKKCYYNPITKSCGTCGNLIQESSPIKHESGVNSQISLPVCLVGVKISDVNNYPKRMLSLKTNCPNWFDKNLGLKKCLGYAKRKHQQKERVLSLLYLCESFNKFTQINLKTSLLKSENTYEGAEKTRGLVHLFFPDRETKIEDFLYDKNSLSDEILNLYSDYKRWLDLSTNIGIPSITIEAFCKHIEYTNDCWMLKSTGHLEYPLYLDGILQYLNNNITKKQLIDNYLFHISLFKLEKTKVDYRLLRRCIIAVERIYMDILAKQISRSRKNENKPTL